VKVVAIGVGAIALTPTLVASDPYVWETTYVVSGGSGAVQVDVLSGGDVKLTETIATGLPLNGT
jgi:hypothetical protein